MANVLDRRKYETAIPQLESKLKDLSKYITVENGKLIIKVEDLYGDVAQIKIDAESITERVEDAEDNIGQLEIRADGIEQTVSEKAQVFTETSPDHPEPPYFYGDVWTDGTDIRVCKYNRPSESDTYHASDWELASDYTNDDVANGEITNRTALVRTTTSGTLTCYKIQSGTNYGVLVRPSGSVDIVSVTWSGGVPTVGSVFASYGVDAVIGRTSDGLVNFENIKISGGVDGYISFRRGTTEYGRIYLGNNGGTTIAPSANAYSYLHVSEPSAYISGKTNVNIKTWDSNGEIIVTSDNIYLYGPVAISDELTVHDAITADKSITSGRYFNSTYTYNYPGSAAASTVASHTIYVSSNGNFIMGSSSSSKRFKHDIKEISSKELDPHLLYDLPVIQFVYNKEYLGNEKDCRYGKELPGFIAEDIQELYPTIADVNDEGELVGWNPQYIIPPMLKLIQEQNGRIEELEKRLKALEEKNATD